MTRLMWDQTGDRLYETGIDRGVLYLSDGSGVAWNGLTGLEEDFSDDGSSPTYLDGVKTADIPSLGTFIATLTAFTYPDEFLEYEGFVPFDNGLLIDNQAPKTFGLSYRTTVGNDVEDLAFGYKIHILYNLMAIPDAVDNRSISNSIDPNEFSWQLSSVPQTVQDRWPTAHVIFDTTELLDPTLAEGIEDVLYGSRTTAARLPTIDELIDLASLWGPKIIVPDMVAGLAQLTPGYGDLNAATPLGFYTALPNGRLNLTQTEGLYQLDI